MRLVIVVAVCLFSLMGCLPSSDANPKLDPNPDPISEPEPEPEPETKIIVPMYSYDKWDMPTAAGEVGNTIVLDVASLDYDKEKEYIWTAWTGEDKGTQAWNRPALGTTGLVEAKLEFEAKFPGYYHITWCPTVTRFECIFWGDIEITGETPVNLKPDVSYTFSEPDYVSLLCSGGCQYLLETNHEYVFNTEIDDDDETHTYFMSTRYVGDSDYEFKQNNLSEDELIFTPSKQGKYRTVFKTYDGHVTVNGPQFTEDRLSFSIRNVNNNLPQTNFMLEDHPNVTASMAFEFDDESRAYIPIIQYYYEQTVTNDACELVGRCETWNIDYDRYQNNRGTEDIPLFKVGDTVRFNAANSSDPDGEELSYLWSGYVKQETGAHFLAVGNDQFTFEPSTEHAGDYFVSLCVQEKGYNSIYKGVNYFTYPLYFPLSQLCPQIQFRVEE